jgi:predicted ester cyclase
MTSLPDLRATIHEQAVDGDMVWTRKLFQGTHLGPLMGLPPSGRPASFEAIEILRIADGKIVEHWAVSDMLSLLQQIGALPSADRGGR